MSEAKTHDLKLNTKYFGDVASRKKNFELRKNDRGFKVGDRLCLHEVLDDGTRTGSFTTRIITYILEGPCYGLQEGYCILSIK